MLLIVSQDAMQTLGSHPVYIHGIHQIKSFVFKGLRDKRFNLLLLVMVVVLLLQLLLLLLLLCSVGWVSTNVLAQIICPILLTLKDETDIQP